jgi:hypothetical protein
MQFGNYKVFWPDKASWLTPVIVTYNWKLQQGRQFTYNVTLLPVYVIIVAVEKQNCVSFLLFTYVAVNNVVNMASVVIAGQQCVRCGRCYQQYETRLWLRI